MGPPARGKPGGRAVSASAQTLAQQYVGKRGLASFRLGEWRASELSFAVTVIDVRANFGRVDLLVQPVAGAGRAWLSSDRVRMDGP